MGQAFLFCCWTRIKCRIPVLQIRIRIDSFNFAGSKGFLNRPKLFNTALPQILLKIVKNVDGNVLLLVSRSIYLYFWQFCKDNWIFLSFSGFDIRIRININTDSWMRIWSRIQIFLQIWNIDVMSFIPKVTGCFCIWFSTIACFTITVLSIAGVTKCSLCGNVLINSNTNKFIICLKSGIFSGILSCLLVKDLGPVSAWDLPFWRPR